MSSHEGAFFRELGLADGAGVVSVFTGKTETRSRGGPLGFESEIVNIVLMADKEAFVSPFADSHFLLEDKLADVLLNATLVGGGAHRKDVVQVGSSGDRLEHLVDANALVVLGERYLSRRLESETVREGRGDRLAVLSVLGHVAESNLLDELSGSSETLSHGEVKGDTGLGDVGHKVVLEEVPAFLSVNGEHGN